MKNSKLWIGIVCTFLLSVTGFAQAPVVPREAPQSSPYQRYTTYQVTFRYGLFKPQSGLSDYIDDMGTRNYSLAGEWVLNKSFAFGAQYTSNYFQKRLPRQVYETTSGAQISAVQTKTFSIQSLQATGKYYFADVTAIVRPYVQAGVGIAYADYTYYLGSLEGDSQGKFNFAAQAAIGTRVLFGRESHFGLDLQLNYQHIPFSYNEVSNAGIAGGWVGIFYRWW
ncbi:acyloxyacyl hydrolase [Cytophagaceae bacterium YF14B1]|uniref:Acyloxyacyl hydrolase n=1 Tax=Xanthocytophaga flava TaxID=3048013 RepID=A0AAE3QTM8_9BACT|nr:hypothetical protein [Xanthocytophaga flavus]MDJ1484731.1 acyloxyacyl hydrolase [Xanthocytophaga flavus]